MPSGGDASIPGEVISAPGSGTSGASGVRQARGGCRRGLILGGLTPDGVRTTVVDSGARGPALSITAGESRGGICGSRPTGKTGSAPLGISGGPTSPPSGPSARGCVGGSIGGNPDSTPPGDSTGPGFASGSGVAGAKKGDSPVSPDGRHSSSGTVALGSGMSVGGAVAWSGAAATSGACFGCGAAAESGPPRGPSSRLLQPARTHVAIARVSDARANRGRVVIGFSSVKAQRAWLRAEPVMTAVAAESNKSVPYGSRSRCRIPLPAGENPPRIRHGPRHTGALSRTRHQVLTPNGVSTRIRVVYEVTVSGQGSGLQNSILLVQDHAHGYRQGQQN